MIKQLLCSFFLVAAAYTGGYAQHTGWFTPLNWGLVPMPLQGNRYDDIYFISHDTGVLVSGFGMIFKTYDGAAHWHLKKAINSGTYFRSVEFSADGQVAIAGSLSGHIYRSDDRGETWDDISANINDTGAIQKRICGLGHYGDTFFGVGWWGSSTARFYKSTDAGITWTTGYLDTSLVTGLVDITFRSPTEGFITGTRKGSESVVLRTQDGGATWTKVFSDHTIGGIIWKIQFVDSLFGVASIEPMYADTVAMIKTTDGGSTWQIVRIGSVNAWTWASIGTQGIGFLNRQQGWVGGYYDGMFETNDGGASWHFLNTNKECDRFFLIDSTMYVSANTVYKYGDSTAAPLGLSLAPVLLHKLYAVQPNPSDGDVAVEFDINKHRTNTVLKIVNLDNRNIYPVMAGYLDPGHYTWHWNGANEPNGNYIVWLGTDEIPLVQKFVIYH